MSLLAGLASCLEREWMPEQLSNRTVEAAEIVWRIIRARRARTELFKPGLFSDPAWDMLLFLFVAGAREQIVTVTELAAATATPIPSAVRWIDVLERNGLLQRKAEPTNMEQDIVELGGRGMTTICDWIENCGLASFRTSDHSAGEA
jgi:DNA-binding MarR family transcriptional regulator